MKVSSGFDGTLFSFTQATTCFASPMKKTSFNCAKVSEGIAWEPAVNVINHFYLFLGGEGNTRFPKTKKDNAVRSNGFFCIKMQIYGSDHAKNMRNNCSLLLICPNIVVFQLRRNLDFLHKSFITLTSCLSTGTDENVEWKQCDQIWRNFAKVAKFYKSSAIFWRFFNIWQNCKPNLETI